jgi:hypothetical protein
MKPARFTLLTLALITWPAAARECPPSAGPLPTIDFLAVHKVTGQLIVDALRRRIHGESGQYQAFSYLRGVKDANAGKWCPKAAYSNLEVDGEIIAYLAKLTPAERQGDAAPLIVDALKSVFPCPHRKER